MVHNGKDLCILLFFVQIFFEIYFDIPLDIFVKISYNKKTIK